MGARDLLRGKGNHYGENCREQVWDIRSAIPWKPAGDRFSTELVDEIEGLPWNPNPGTREPQSLQAPISLGIEVDVPVSGLDVFKPVVVAKQHYILKRDLLKFGFAPGCKACAEVQRGKLGQAESSIHPSAEPASRRRVKKTLKHASDWKSLTIG